MVSSFSKDCSVADLVGSNIGFSNCKCGVVPSTTHLASHKSYFFIYGDDFVSSSIR